MIASFPVQLMGTSALLTTFLKCQGHMRGTIYPLELCQEQGSARLRGQVTCHPPSLSAPQMPTVSLLHGSNNLVPLPCLMQKSFTELGGLDTGLTLPAASLGQSLQGASTSSGIILKGTNPPPSAKSTAFTSVPQGSGSH